MTSSIKPVWDYEETKALFEKPLMDLLFEAQSIHRQHFDPNKMQTSTLLSIKTGTCPEDCGYCSQSGHYKTGLERERLLDVDKVLVSAKQAKDNGATRFCMGAAWRNPPAKDFPKVLDMIKGVKDLGMEACVTLGMLSDEQTVALKEAGLDYYNHNVDTSPEYYPKVSTTRTYQERLDTIDRVRDNNINVCCGGIVGIGETRDDRISFLLQLANMPQAPQSVPINALAPTEGTPLGKSKFLDTFEYVRMVAAARIMMPTSYVRLAGGRYLLNDETQALCFFAGVNSIHCGEVMLTTPAPGNRDKALLARLGMTTLSQEELHAQTNADFAAVSC